LHLQPVPRHELRITIISGMARIIIDIMPTITGIFLVSTIDTMRATTAMATTPSTNVNTVLGGLELLFAGFCAAAD
jgi:hypothetical protein